MNIDIKYKYLAVHKSSSKIYLSSLYNFTLGYMRVTVSLLNKILSEVYLLIKVNIHMYIYICVCVCVCVCVLLLLLFYHIYKMSVVFFFVVFYLR